MSLTISPRVKLNATIKTAKGVSAICSEMVPRERQDRPCKGGAPEDHRDRGERNDVVHHGRLAKEPSSAGKAAAPDHTTLALQAVEKRWLRRRHRPRRRRGFRCQMRCRGPEPKRPERFTAGGDNGSHHADGHGVP